MDIVLDLETLGKKPGCVVLSISAIVFNRYPTTTQPPQANIFNRNIDIFSSLMAGLIIDKDTVKWWQNQDDDAKNELKNPAPVSLPQAALDFKQWFNSLIDVNGIRLVWAKSPQFDCAIWEAACAAIGVEVPWDFRSPRDIRTLFDIAQFNEKTLTSVGQGLVAHSGVDDCLLAIKQIQTAFERWSIPVPSAPPAIGMPPVPSFKG